MTGYALKDHILIFGKGPMFFLASLCTPKCLWPNPASHTMDAWNSVPGKKRPERDAGDQTSAEEEHTELYLHCFYTPPWRGSETLGQLYAVFTMLLLFIYFINVTCFIKYSRPWQCVLALTSVVDISNSLLLLVEDSSRNLAEDLNRQQILIQCFVQ